MAEQIINLCRNSNVGMSVKTRPPTLKPQQPRTQTSSSLVEEISLKFKLQLECSYFQVPQQGSWDVTTLVGRRRTPKLPFVAYTLPVWIFNNGDRTLEQYLTWQLKMYQDVINIELVADQIIKHWVNKVKEEGNWSVFGRVYPLEIVIEFCNFEMIEARQPGLDFYGMVPTCDDAMETMLKRVEIEEMGFGVDDKSCVICLEEMIKEEEENIVITEMPCLHVFHEECIRKWLKTSHYCPTCRFRMPTK